MISKKYIDTHINSCYSFSCLSNPILDFSSHFRLCAPSPCPTIPHPLTPVISILYKNIEGRGPFLSFQRSNVQTCLPFSPNSFHCHTSENSPVSPTIATLPKMRVSNPCVCHTSETPRGCILSRQTPDDRTPRFRDRHASHSGRSSLRAEPSNRSRIRASAAQFISPLSTFNCGLSTLPA